MNPKSSTPPASGDDFLAALVKGLSQSAPPLPTDRELMPLSAPAEIPGQINKDPRYAFLRNPDVQDAKWDISGAFIYCKTLLGFHDFFWKQCGLRMINWVHDAPLCIWNSGRLKMSMVMDQANIAQALQGYEERSIPVHLTFSNSMLKEEHLDDSRCNIMLQMLDASNRGGGNGVIICSDLLAEHVRRKFPKLKLVASVIKVSHEDGKGKLDYYRRMANTYDKVMIHPDDNFNLALLEKLDNKDRYEILVNEPCMKNCPVRKVHYQLLSQLSLNLLNSNLEKKQTELIRQNRCQDMEGLLFSEDRRTAILSRLELKALYDLGFRNFKIQGRGMINDNAILQEMIRLMFNHNPACDQKTARVLQRFFGNNRDGVGAPTGL